MTETLVLGGGCFWCTEAVYVKVRGVSDVESGYSNGQTVAPTYEQVCTGRTGHTEAIVSESTTATRRFVAGVDAAAVMVNASTRFTDGGEFGFGAEIGISTQKLHARG